MSSIDEAAAQVRALEPDSEAEFLNYVEVARRALLPMRAGTMEKAIGIAMDVLGKRTVEIGLTCINNRTASRAFRDRGHQLVDIGIALEKVATCWIVAGEAASFATACRKVA